MRTSSRQSGGGRNAEPDVRRTGAVVLVQRRDGGTGVFQPKTWADGDDFTCFGGRRWDEYPRRNIRTYSSMSREVLSALMITHVAKHNDVSESGFTTTPSAYKGSRIAGCLGCGVGRDTARLFLQKSGTQPAHRIAESPPKQQFSTDSQSVHPNDDFQIKRYSSSDKENRTQKAHRRSRTTADRWTLRLTDSQSTYSPVGSATNRLVRIVEDQIR